MAKPTISSILDKLQTAPNYTPANIASFTDWSLEAGDVVTIVQDGVERKVPVFAQTINWAGATQSTIEATGKKKRDGIAKAQETKSGGSINFNNPDEEYGSLLFDSLGDTAEQIPYSSPPQYRVEAIARAISASGKVIEIVTGKILCTSLYNNILNSGRTSGWNLAYNMVARPPVIGTGESTTFTYKTPDSSYNTQKTVNFSMQKGTPSADGGYVSVSDGNGVVARIDISNWWQVAYEAGWKAAAEKVAFDNASNYLNIMMPDPNNVGESAMFGSVAPYTNSQRSSRPSPESVTVTSVARLRWRKADESAFTYGTQEDTYSKTYDL